MAAGARWGAWAGLALVGAVTLAVLAQAQALLRADMASMGARRQATLWASGTLPPPAAHEWQRAEADLLQALRITPYNPGLQEQLGDLHAVAGRRDWNNPEVSRPHYERAVAAYRLALQWRATDAQTWASLAAALQGAGQVGGPLHQAWATSLSLAPHEGHVQPMLMEVVLGTWNEATPAMKQWAMRQFEISPEQRRKAINASAARHGLRFDIQASAAAGASAP